MPEHQAHAEPFRRLAFTARADRLKTIKASLTSTEGHRAALDEIVTRVAAFMRSVPNQRALMVSGSLDEILDHLHKITRDLGGVLSTAADAGIKEDVPLRDIPNVLAASGQCRDARAAADVASVACALVGRRKLTDFPRAALKKLAEPGSLHLRIARGVERFDLLPGQHQFQRRDVLIQCSGRLPAMIGSTGGSLCRIQATTT